MSRRRQEKGQGNIGLDSQKLKSLNYETRRKEQIKVVREHSGWTTSSRKITWTMQVTAGRWDVRKYVVS